jgi:O-antigen ligase
VAGLLVCALAVLGGSSRASVTSQAALGISSIVALAATLWPLEFAPLEKHRSLLLFAGACVALPLLQLIPLPAPFWAKLPGHAVYAEIARATGTDGWRPLSLTPDLTKDALQALLAPLAIIAAALYLDIAGRKLVAALFVIAAIASSLLGLVQLATGGGQLSMGQQGAVLSPDGLFANRNHQAAFLACAIPLTAALVPRFEGKRALLATIAILLPALSLLVSGTLLTGSRMGLVLLALAVVGALSVLRTRGFLRRPPSRLALAGWIGAGVAIALFATVVFLNSQLWQRFQHEEFAMDTRWAALPSIIATAQTFLPFGSGFGSFDSVYRQFEPNALLSTSYLNQAHNEPLQLLIEGGIPAVALLALFLGWWVRAGTAVVAGQRFASPGLARASLVVSILLMVSSLVDYPLRTALLAALFTSCCVELAIGWRGRAGRTR